MCQVGRSVCVVVLLALGLAACGSDEAGAERLSELEVGISRDSMFTLIGTGVLSARGADTARVDRGFRRSRYVVAGKTYEVYFVRDEPGDVTEPVLQAKETPIVIGPDGTVLGWGWRFYVEEGMEKLSLPTPIKERVIPSETSPPRSDSSAVTPGAPGQRI